MLTLREKLKLLRSTVAVPTDEDWQLLCETEEEKAVVIGEANTILLDVLDGCKTSRYETWGDIARAVFEPMDKLARKHPNAGLSDSEALLTIAMFFALNKDPRMFNFFRYREYELH